MTIEEMYSQALKDLGLEESKMQPSELQERKLTYFVACFDMLNHLRDISELPMEQGLTELDNLFDEAKDYIQDIASGDKASLN